MLIQETVVVTKMQCLLCGVNNVCRAERIWKWDGPFVVRRFAKSHCDMWYAYFNILIALCIWEDCYCVGELQGDFTFGWKDFSYKVTKKRGAVPCSISTVRLWTMPNHTLTLMSPSGIRRSIVPSTQSGRFVAEQNIRRFSKVFAAGSLQSKKWWFDKINVSFCMYMWQSWIYREHHSWGRACESVWKILQRLTYSL